MTGLDPSGLLAAPPEVYAEIVAILVERAEQQEKQAQSDNLKARLRSALGK